MTFAPAVVVPDRPGYTGGMSERWKEAARELLTNPLAWASYAAWAAVWLTVTGVFGWREMRWWADGLLVAFLIAWMVCLVDELVARRVFDVFLAALTLLTIAILWFVPSGATPILLILLATQFAHRFEPRRLTLVMVGINLVFAAIMVFVWGVGPRDAGFSLLGFIGFQMFAVLVMRYAIRAEEMAEDLKSVNARLLATRSLLGETARDQERLRLSRELHDVAGHKVTALKLNLRGLARRLDDEAAAEVGKATDLADELLQDLRSVVRHLRKTEGIELSEALRELGRPFPRPKLELDFDEQARVPRADQAEALLRVVQEALTNAARHGPAETLRVRLQRQTDRLVLTVEDDGRVSGEIRPGNGLTGMRERLAELEGSLDIARSDAGGLKLTATLPLELH
jgi:signal transduction histidine kinase